jgi:intracellular septation protein A
MSVDQPAGRPAWVRALLLWVPSITMNIVLPIVTYSALRDADVSEAGALIASGVWPLLEALLSLAIQRRVDEFSVFTLIFLALGVIAAFGFNSPRLVLAKESAVHGLFGLVLLGSLAAPKPLMFYFGRRFATNGTAESVAWWNGLWQYAGFRASQRLITIVWGVATLVAALVQIWLAYHLSTDTMAVVSNVLPLAVLGGLITWTVRYGRARSRAAQQRAGAAAAEPVVVNTASEPG